MTQSVLLLSDDAKAVATPKLEIKTDEVRVSHSATVGQMDQEQLFYLRSRGLSHDESVRTLIKSFLAEALDQLSKAKKDEKTKQLNKALDKF